MQHVRQLERTGEAILIPSAADDGGRGFFPIGRSERRTGRRVAGVLALTVGVAALGLVAVSRTRPVSAIRTSAPASGSSPGPHSSLRRAEAVRRVAASTTLAKPPLVFIENQGQGDPEVGYYVQGSETALSFTSQGLRIGVTDSKPSRGLVRKAAWGREPVTLTRRIALDFVGANPDVKSQG